MVELSKYQQKIAADRVARIKPLPSAWLPDGRFAHSVAAHVPRKVQTREAIEKLRAAVDSGRDMPWAMVGIKWEVAVKLLELLEVSDGES